MKKYLIYSFLLLSPFVASSQDGREAVATGNLNVTNIGISGDFAHSYINLKMDQRVLSADDDFLKNIDGNPFLYNDFLLGQIGIKGKPYVQAFLRYDVLHEDIHIKPELSSKKILLLQKDREVDFIIKGDTLVYRQIKAEDRDLNGFFIKHYVGDQLELLEKPLIVAHKAVEPVTGYDRRKPARLEHVKEYYVVWKDGKVQNAKLRQRMLKKEFTSEKAKSYLSDNKIKSVEDLVAFAAFLNSEK